MVRIRSPSASNSRLRRLVTMSSVKAMTIKAMPILRGKESRKTLSCGKDPGQDTEDKSGKKQDSKDRGAELDAEGEHLAGQFHQVGDGLS